MEFEAASSSSLESKTSSSEPTAPRAALREALDREITTAPSSEEVLTLRRPAVARPGDQPAAERSAGVFEAAARVREAAVRASRTPAVEIIAKLSQDRTKLKAQVAALEEALETLERDRDAFASARAELVREVARLGDALGEERAARDALARDAGAEIERLRAELEQVLEDHQGQPFEHDPRLEAERTEDVASLRAELAAFRAELETRDAERDELYRLRRLHAQLEHEHEDAAQALRALEASRAATAELEAELEVARAGTRAIAAELEAAHVTNGAIASELDAARVAKNTFESALDESRHASAAFAAELESARIAQATLAGELEQARAQAESLSGEAEHARLVATTFEGEAQELRALAAELRAELDEQRSLGQSLASELDARAAFVGEQEALVAGLRAEAEQHQATRAEREALEALRAENEALAARLAESETRRAVLEVDAKARHAAAEETAVPAPISAPASLASSVRVVAFGFGRADETREACTRAARRRRTDATPAPRARPYPLIETRPGRERARLERALRRLDCRIKRTESARIAAVRAREGELLAKLEAALAKLEQAPLAVAAPVAVAAAPAPAPGRARSAKPPLFAAGGGVLAKLVAQNLALRAQTQPPTSTSA